VDSIERKMIKKRMTKSNISTSGKIGTLIRFLKYSNVDD
jgi:hypothetical protein